MALGSVSMLGAQIAETVVLGWIGTDALAALGYAFPATFPPP